MRLTKIRSFLGYFSLSMIVILAIAKTWQPIYSHPTPPKPVSRLTEWISHNDTLYVVGALSSLTGQRLGYDIAAWQKWWRLQRVQIDY